MELNDIMNKVSGRGPRSLIVRHAERFHVPSISESLGIGLTEKGKRDAFDMGRSIEGFDLLRLYHSPALRCRETAESIAQGFVEQGGNVGGIVETWDLCAPYLEDDRVLKEAERLGYDFMRSWFVGRFDPEWIRPTPEAADMVLAPILGRLADDHAENRLDIHVSHDWEIVLLREELLKIRYEDAGWVGYLEGLHFSRDGSGFLAGNGEAQTSFTFSSGRRVP